MSAGGIDFYAKVQRPPYVYSQVTPLDETVITGSRSLLKKKIHILF